MVLESLRDRVRQRANSSRIRRVVGVLVEIGVQESVRLTDGHVDAQPVASGGDGLSRDVVVTQPRRDLLDGLRRRSNQSLDLMKRQVATRVETSST